MCQHNFASLKRYHILEYVNMDNAESTDSDIEDEELITSKQNAGHKSDGEPSTEISHSFDINHLKDTFPKINLGSKFLQNLLSNDPKSSQQASTLDARKGDGLPVDPLDSDDDANGEWGNISFK